ncbi:MAG: hypothetical protein K0R54_248 [Clostridiaceae bacterium]|jgi:hypothetical protein|nr:hypothetical protein [Clostridiaceae bacterium]
MDVTTRNKILKKRTEATAFAILESVKNIDFNSLITDIFVYTESPIAKELITKYEYQLFLSIENPDKFKENLNGFYKDTAFFIKKNKLYKEFLSFFYFIFSTLHSKKVINEDAFSCYINILCQQFCYLVNTPQILYGIEANNKLLTKLEPYPYLDLPFINASKSKPNEHTMKTIFTEYKKLGYNIKSIEDYMIYNSNDQLITNMFYVLSNFISEDTENIVPQNYYRITEMFYAPNIITSTNQYKELLHEKRYHLPSSGVLAEFKNSNQFSKIFFQEIFTEDRFMLLYKVTATNEKEFSGLYDNKLEFFYCPWTDTNEGKNIVGNIENFILEVYCCLTTDIEYKYNDSLVKRLHVIRSKTDEINSDLPSVVFSYQQNKNNTNEKEKNEIRFFDKTKYSEETIRIHPYIRKLPVGAKASDEAIALAQEYHYLLGKNETFVRPFEKKVYKK